MKALTFNALIRDMNNMSKNICKIHPNYKAIRPPTTIKDCSCKEIYERSLKKN